MQVIPIPTRLDPHALATEVHAPLLQCLIKSACLDLVFISFVCALWSSWRGLQHVRCMETIVFGIFV